MVQFPSMDYENDNLFIMKTWYKGFYTSFPSVELNKKDDDVRMNVLINDLCRPKSYDYVNVDWSTGDLKDSWSVVDLSDGESLF